MHRSANVAVASINALSGKLNIFGDLAKLNNGKVVLFITLTLLNVADDLSYPAIRNCPRRDLDVDALS